MHRATRTAAAAAVARSRTAPLHPAAALTQPCPYSPYSLRVREAEETRVKKYKELLELGLEDDEELVDKATEKERAWDDWKDNHPYGIGNTKRI